MRKTTTVGRVANRREVSGLTSKLGDILQRRRGSRVERNVQRLDTLKEGGVLGLHASELPLSDLLNKARITSRPARDTSYLHVSDLVSKCLRKIALIDKLGIPPKPQSLRLTDLLTFAQGDAIHDVLKSSAVRGGGGVVWGKWGCKCGTVKTPEPCLYDAIDKDRTCPACKGPIDVYQEVTIKNDEHMIVGNPDLILYLADPGALHITELKSISHDAWKELVRPLADHVIQVLFYWYLLSQLGYKLTDKVSILYATKGWIFSGDPFKEFVIDAPSQMHRLEPFLEDALAVKASRAGGKLPLRICANADAPVAKKCEMCAACFGVAENEKPVNITMSQALGSRTKATRRPRT